MAIESNTNDYKTHKYKYNVYVDLNTKTKLGENLLKQYHEQTSKHCMDIGRIGYHDDYGKYKIDYYTLKELKVVPKLIIRVIEKAVSRAGKDIYQLRTYMSKFGQLNFLLLVDQNCSELYLVENVYISNINHSEEYETLIWRINHYNQKPLPLKEVFYEYGIKANADDYGKSWKESDLKINNIIVSKAKAEMSIKIANQVGSVINQKALVASLNHFNNSGEYGKKITKAYSEKVAKSEEINKMASSPKLENTLNNVLVKTVEQRTDKKDLKNNNNLETYKKVIDIQFSASKDIAVEVEKQCTKSTLKEYMLASYQKDNQKQIVKDEKEENNKHQKEFEKIIDYKFERKTKNEKTDFIEEKLDKKKHLDKKLPLEYKDFENKVVNIDLKTDRFFEKENPKTKKEREKTEKFNKKQIKLERKLLAKKQRKMKRISAVCNVDEELKKSKKLLGLTSQKKKKKKKFNIFENQERKIAKKEKEELKIQRRQEKKEEIVAKLEAKIKKQNLKLAKNEENKQEKTNKKIRKQQERKELKESKKKSQTLLVKLKERSKKKYLETMSANENKAKTKKEEFRPVLKENKQEKPIEKENIVDEFRVLKKEESVQNNQKEKIQNNKVEQKIEIVKPEIKPEIKQEVKQEIKNNFERKSIVEQENNNDEMLENYVSNQANVKKKKTHELEM